MKVRESDKKREKGGREKTVTHRQSNRKRERERERRAREKRIN